MDKVKHFFQQSWLLIIASFCFGLLIAVANAAWWDNILQNEQDKFNNLVKCMIADANTTEIVLENVEVESGRGKGKATSVWKVISVGGKTIGWAFTCEGSGFADKIKLVLTVDADFEKLKGYGVLSSNETPGFGDKIKEPYYRQQFDGAPATELELVKLGDPDDKDSEIVAITGATVSSEAVVTTMNMYVGPIKNHMQKEGLIDNGR